MDLKIPYGNVTSADQAFNAVKSNITSQMIEEKFKIKADISYFDSSKEIVAKGSGFELKMMFAPNEAHINLDLGFYSSL